MSKLPIFEIESDLKSAMVNHSRCIVEAPTGSGKSTQIPQMILDHRLVDGQILVLQPRRMAARMLARRVAEERYMQVGQEVGYHIRLDDKSSGQTKIKYITEGILLRYMLSDPKLLHYGAIIFDEFHERHLYGDVSLARVMALQKIERPDLKIIVMSATLDAAQVEPYLAPCAVLKSAGRTYPVDIEYVPPKWVSRDTPIWEVAARAFSESGEKGDALVFMPGAYEIRKTVDELKRLPVARDALILPLHGELPPDDQDRAVGKSSQRKIIVSTNVAETSLTIDGIRLVIDGGLARKARFDTYRGINTLMIEKISRASADQRAGRAGRTAPGRCIRCWTEREHQGRPLQETPEIKRVDLSEIILNLKATGVSDLAALPWFEAPDERALEQAFTLLIDLDALDPETKALTPVGLRMAAFPVHPRYARLLIEAGEWDCVREVALIAALTQGRPVLLPKPSREVKAAREKELGETTISDFIQLMRAWSFADRHQYQTNLCRALGIHAAASRQVKPIVRALLGVAKRQRLSVNEIPASDEAIQRCVLAGFMDHLAVRRDKGTLRCHVIHGRKGNISKDSGIQDAQVFVAAEMKEIGGAKRDVNVTLSLNTAVDEAWLRAKYPQDFTDTSQTYFDSTSRRVVARKEKRFRDLILEEGPGGPPDENEAAVLLAAEVLAGNLVLKKWDKTVEQWIHRVNTLHQACPEWGVPAFTASDHEAVLQQLFFGAFGYKEIKDRPVLPELKKWLPAELVPLIDQYAPERLELPSGRRAKITYNPEGAPTLGARIQDLYGVEKGLSIADGRVDLLIHIQAPNHRPVQMTTDLENFWKNTYPQVKKEMQRKYPKHEWR